MGKSKLERTILVLKLDAVGCKNNWIVMCPDGYSGIYPSEAKALRAAIKMRKEEENIDCGSINIFQKFDREMIKAMDADFVTMELIYPGALSAEINTIDMPERSADWELEQFTEYVRKKFKNKEFKPMAYHVVIHRWVGTVDLGTVYLGGTFRAAEDVLASSNPDEKILRANVKGSGLYGVVKTRYNTYAGLNRIDTVVDDPWPSK